MLPVLPSLLHQYLYIHCHNKGSHHAFPLMDIYIYTYSGPIRTPPALPKCLSYSSGRVLRTLHRLMHGQRVDHPRVCHPSTSVSVYADIFSHGHITMTRHSIKTMKSPAQNVYFWAAPLRVGGTLLALWVLTGHAPNTRIPKICLYTRAVQYLHLLYTQQVKHVQKVHMKM